MKNKELSQSAIDSVIALYSNGQYQEAIDSIKALTKSYPENALLNNIAGACYAGLGQLASAVKSYEKAISIDPEYSKAYYNLGDTYHSQSNYDESIISYEKAIELDPTYAEALNNLGNVLRESSQLELAVKAYEKALAVNAGFVEANYGLGIVFHELGQLDDMLECLEKVINIEPSLAEAHNLIGSGLEQLGQIEEAVISYQKAIEINPQYSEAYNNLGNAFKNIGRLEDAVISYQNALKLNPDFPALHNNLGNSFKELGKLDEALKSYQNALVYNPDYPDSLNNLGVISAMLGELEESVVYYKKAISVKPNFAEASNNLGNSLKRLSLFDEAVKSYKKAIEINPNFEDAYNNLGLTLTIQSQLDEAVVSFMKAIKINPKFDIAYNNLAHTYRQLKQHDSALESYEKAIEINPYFFQAYNNYGNILAKDFNLPDEAINCFNKAIEINPDFAIAHNNLAHALRDLNQLDDALKSYEKAMNLEPDLDNVLGNILSTKMNSCNWEGVESLLIDLRDKITSNQKVVNPFTLLGLIDDSALQLKVARLIMNDNHPKSNDLGPIESYPKHQKIRIGYFSGDFREHPVAFLSAELYEAHDRDHFEIHAFSFGPDTNDEMNLRIKAGVDYFHEVHAKAPKHIAELARSLEIDIAVDLTGFTAEARTDIFAMSAAPLQVNYLAYAGSMGLDYIDYIMADHMVIPKEEQSHYLEKIAYLPNSFMVQGTQINLSDKVFTREEVGLPADGFVFCCFNNFYKITPNVYSAWMRMLSKVDKSVLWLPIGNIAAVNNLKKEAKKYGIAESRIIFAPHLPFMIEHLNRLHLADLFLDTLPYNAHTTCSDALRMGLPVLTCLGRSFVSRVAGSLLSALNLPELITNTPEEYESLAIELATNPGKLKAIKDKLANNLSTAPLYDTKLFAKNLESAYTQMYERHHKGLKPDHIYVE
ncbi:tetratricopeptide repeat protein [Candidatus Pseudothioglobus singularis]|nr:tetratricopeptide repeat protein [Candidatus Pseudothioglobus singularis]